LREFPFSGPKLVCTHLDIRAANNGHHLANGELLRYPATHTDRAPDGSQISSAIATTSGSCVTTITQYFCRSCPSTLLTHAAAAGS